MNIKKIAEEAGYSPSTVSRVLSGKKCDIKISERTKTRILEVCRKHDYNPSIHASRLFSNESKTIGLLTPSSPGLDDYSLSKTMNAAYAELNARGYRLLPLFNDAKFIRDKEYLSLFKRQEIDALIIWGLEESAGAWLAELHDNKMPFILASNRCGDYPSVCCDDQEGMRQIAAHCIENGARKICYLTTFPIECCRRREAGFRAAVKEVDCRIIETGVEIQAGTDAVSAALQFKPDTIICANDKLAIGVMQGLQERGFSIPAEIKVAGADNIEMGRYVSVPLTTFDNSPSECGRLCTQILLDHLIDKAPLRSVVIPPEIQLRQSTQTGS
jgi:DNA-binding LacI/PurR family transcriptional regulator